MTTRPRRRGYALMLVMLEVVLIAALWGVAHRQMAGTMSFLTNQQGQAQLDASRNTDAYKPLARALSLLETGPPPDGGAGVYTCNATILTASGPAYFLITYLKQAPGPGAPGSTDETWTVTSTQQAVDGSGLADWNKNLLPATFAN